MTFSACRALLISPRFTGLRTISARRSAIVGAGYSMPPPMTVFARICLDMWQSNIRVTSAMMRQIRAIHRKERLHYARPTRALAHAHA